MKSLLAILGAVAASLIWLTLAVGTPILIFLALYKYVFGG